MVVRVVHTKTHNLHYVADIPLYPADKPITHPVSKIKNKLIHLHQSNNRGTSYPQQSNVIQRDNSFINIDIDTTKNTHKSKVFGGFCTRLLCLFGILSALAAVIGGSIYFTLPTGKVDTAIATPRYTHVGIQYDIIIEIPGDNFLNDTNRIMTSLLNSVSTLLPDGNVSFINVKTNISTTNTSNIKYSDITYRSAEYYIPPPIVAVRRLQLQSSSLELLNITDCILVRNLSTIYTYRTKVSIFVACRTELCLNISYTKVYSLQNITNYHIQLFQDFIVRMTSCTGKNISLNNSFTLPEVVTIFVSSSPTPTASITPSNSDSSSSSHSYSNSPSNSISQSNTPSASISQSNTPSTSISQSNTPTPSNVSSASCTPSNSGTSTTTVSPTPSSTGSPTPTPSSTSSFNPTSTPGSLPPITLPANDLVTGLIQPVSALCSYRDKLYISGNFNSYPYYSYLLAYNGSYLLPVTDRFGVSIDNWVLSMAVFNNTLILGGRFSRLSNGTMVNYVIGFLEDDNNEGDWILFPDSATTVGLNNFVLAIGIFGNITCFGGTFTATTSGTSTSYITCWNGTNFQFFSAAGANNVVRHFNVYQNNLIVGGWFTMMNGINCRYIAKYNGTTWLPLLNGIGSPFNGFDNAVYTSIVFQNKLFLGGIFRQLQDGRYTYYLASCDGIQISPFSIMNLVNRVSPMGLGASTSVMWSNSTTAIITGYFSETMSNGNKIDKIGRFNGTNLFSMYHADGTGGFRVPVGTTSVTAIAEYRNKVYIGGGFKFSSSSYSKPLNYIVQYNGIVLEPVPISNRYPAIGIPAIEVKSIYSCQGSLYIGGNFEDIGRNRRNYITYYNGTFFNSLNNDDVFDNNGVNDVVNIMIEYNSKLYIGGKFTTLANGTIVNRLVIFNPVTKLFELFRCNSSIGVFDGEVNGFAIHNMVLYISGTFTMLADSAYTVVNRILVYDSTSGKCSKLVIGGDIGFNNDVNVLQVYQDRLYLAGSFTGTGNSRILCEVLCVWNGLNIANLTSDNTKRFVAGSKIAGMAILNNILYIGGNISGLIDGTVLNHIVKYDGLSFSPLYMDNQNTGVNNFVKAVIMFQNRIVMVGPFTSLGGTTMNSMGTIATSLHIVSYDGNQFISYIYPSDGFTPGLQGTLTSMGIHNNELYVGGTILSLTNGTTPVNNIIKINHIE